MTAPSSSTPFLLSDILALTSGRLLSRVAEQFDGIGTDTRQPLNQQLFIALKGDSYDAHDFLNSAVRSGAAGLLVHRDTDDWSLFKDKITVILVPDTLIALQQLAKFHRQQWGKKLVAITGSNGKTTTKEFTAQILSPYKNVHYSKGSYNNHWGLPFTLLGLEPQHDLAICEMGMNHAGEITCLVELAQPDIVGVTMVGRAHLEGLGSLDAIAKAKSEIYFTELADRKPFGLFNLDNPWTLAMKKRWGETHCLTFSDQYTDCDVHFQLLSMSLNHLELKGTIQGMRGHARVPVFGKQNLTNLMFAATAALACGLSPEQIWSALPRCQTTWGRNQLLTIPTGGHILFDGYNANPDSQKALIENLQVLTLDGPLIGVFGEMRELGTHSDQLHEELGQLVSSAPFDQVVFIGQFGSAFERGFLQSKPSLAKKVLRTFESITADAVHCLQETLDQKPLITIKGSRGIHLERVLEALVPPS